MSAGTGVREAVLIARKAGVPLRIGAKVHDKGEQEYLDCAVAPLLNSEVEYLGELNTKQGSRLVRWAAVEAVQRAGDGRLAQARARIQERRGSGIGKVAAARKLLTLVFYGLRDGHIRCLAGRPA
jgi:hypothetical protein